MLSPDEAHRSLEARYGRVVQRGTPDVWELILWENVGYLVPDDRRAVAFRALERDVGFDPDAILACDKKKLAAAIREGGMLPMHRAEKIRECARVCNLIGGVRALRASEDLHRTLKRFPGFGNPSADRAMLFLHRTRTLAPDSNVLRVMYRLGWIEEEASYAETYRAATDWIQAKLPESFEEIVSLHHLLRVHGQTVCKRTPRCRGCALENGCNQRGLE